MKKKILKKAFKDKTLVGIRTQNLDWDELIIGYIVKVDELNFTINEIDEFSQYIGNTTINIEDVLHIEYDDIYIKNLNFIIENKFLFDPNKRVSIYKDESNLSPFISLVKDNGEILTIYFDDESYVTGIVIDFDDNFILIKNIGSDGYEDGYTCYCIDLITNIRYNGVIEQKIKILHNKATTL